MRTILSVRGKLWGLVAVATLALLAVVGAALYFTYERMFEDRVTALRFVTDTAYSLAAKYEAEEKAGRLTREQAQAAFRDDVSSIKYGENEYVFLYTFEGTVVASRPTPALIGKNLRELKDANGFYFVREAIRIATMEGAGGLRYMWERESGHAVPKVSYVRGFAPWQMLMGTGVYIDDLAVAFMSMLWKLLIVVAVLGVPAVALIALVGQMLSSTIRALSQKMRRLADGDLTVSFSEATRRDELGAMGQAVLVFKENAAAKQALEAEQEAAKRRAEEQKRQAMLQLADSFEHSVSNVIHSVTSQASDMEGKVRTMSGASGRTEELAAAVSAATEQTSANVQTVAAASEELSASIDEISRQVATSSRVALEAVDLASRANKKVSGLADAAEKIGQVVTLINGIASQTNLLALNATIEAARAGDAGKGFAVVAGEVKTLATQTAKATEEIAGQVGSIQSVTREAVGEIQGVSKVIGQISEIATTISAAVEEQGAATKEISRNVQQAAAGAKEVASNISEVNSATRDTGQLAGEVLSTSQALSWQINTLENDVNSFLKTVRSA
jgi:methyl-accepting chemotaxis protein